MITLFDLSYYTGTHHLLAFAGGDFGVWLERQSDAAIEAMVMNSLRRMFGREVPGPSQMVATSREYRGMVRIYLAFARHHEFCKIEPVEARFFLILDKI